MNSRPGTLDWQGFIYIIVHTSCQSPRFLRPLTAVIAYNSSFIALTLCSLYFWNLYSSQYTNGISLISSSVGVRALSVVGMASTHALHSAVKALLPHVSQPTHSVYQLPGPK
ncbi:hypothetical protein PsYK624_106240 [Phanerochaete sordida]|uniref:Uncharacterized protein n=1 Tax=Phanerochaete sordida TaxID=48140 RepID=A0A9P3GHL4_9APHY|nr:hypothetical protein PsYK624_106240 [Phanerochaete sordida]